jgi:hypothetical protein
MFITVRALRRALGEVGFEASPPAQAGRGASLDTLAVFPGDVAEWLRSGLQSRLHRFDSGRRLENCLQINSFWSTADSDKRLLSHDSPRKPLTSI